uniref:Uncharacterized protein n=1 Tax=Oryza sativa subsp. japonica TaxID=39947 RepID=Q8GS05_ORYSJ|nr:hypothetical protein [Oryza sativa Japonica Group]BAC20825.1 hypothetical protein [Oryza sativa Japonica Group]
MRSWCTIASGSHRDAEEAEQSRRDAPKNLIARLPVQVSQADGVPEAPARPGSVRARDQNWGRQSSSTGNKRGSAIGGGSARDGEWNRSSVAVVRRRKCERQRAEPELCRGGGSASQEVRETKSGTGALSRWWERFLSVTGVTVMPALNQIQFPSREVRETESRTGALSRWWGRFSSSNVGALLVCYWSNSRARIGSVRDGEQN